MPNLFVDVSFFLFFAHVVKFRFFCLLFFFHLFILVGG